MVSGRIAATWFRRLLSDSRCAWGSPSLRKVNLLRAMHSPDHSTKGTPSARGPRVRPVASDGLQGHGFRVSFISLAGSFSPFPHGTCPLSVAPGNRALEGGPPSFPQDFTCLVVLRNESLVIPHDLDGTVTHSGAAFQGLGVWLVTSSIDSPYNPHLRRSFPRPRQVWARPRSLATTEGLSVDFASSDY